MKYGQTFHAQSVPQWAPYNVDYNELKNLIKYNTTRNEGQAMAIPGQANEHLATFEREFFNELANQHDRVDLFAKSKADEISRRLQYLQKAVFRLLARATYTNGQPPSQKRQRRFQRYDGQIARCDEDAKSLQRFIDAQREAFRKILKKYRKWTGSRSLEDRFNREILNDPKSFTKRDLRPLRTEATELLATLRAASADVSEISTPRSVLSRHPSVQIEGQAVPQTYWNEYDNGSEAEDEPYAIYINPDAETTFPGAKTITYVISKAKGPVASVRRWFSPSGSPEERQPLNRNQPGGYFAEAQGTDTEADDEAYASSSDFPSGYAAHYATFPSVRDQRASKNRERVLFHATIGSFSASVVLLTIASILITTGRHRLRVEVDAGAIVGVVSSLFFATLGLGTMLYRDDNLGWLHRSLVGLTFAAICVLNGILLVVVAGNTGL